MKKISIVLCLLLQVTAATVFAQTPIVSNMHKYSVVPPIGWEIGVEEGKRPNAVSGSNMSFLEPVTATSVQQRKSHETNKEFITRINKTVASSVDSGKFRTNILIQVNESRVKTIKEHAVAILKSASKVATYKVVSEKAASLNGSEAIDRISSISANGQNLKLHEIMTIKSGKVYSLSLASSSVAFEKYNVIFERVVKSFTWK